MSPLFFTVLVAAAALASASLQSSQTQCYSVSAGYQESNSPVVNVTGVIKPGQDTAQLDFYRECHGLVDGVMVSACDDDIAPKILITGDLHYANIYRNGDVQGYAGVSATVYCKPPIYVV